MESFRFILGSQSPRRKELLESAGIPVTVQNVSIQETINRENPSRIVSSLAEQKAIAHTRLIHRQFADENCVLLTADTLVFFQGRPIGKPDGQEEAKEMLSRLSGKGHEVLTGVCLRLFRNGDMEKEILWCEKTEVEFFSLRSWQIDWYLKTGEWKDKAGGYGIQGKAAPFVKKIGGSYSNVVGLPLGEVLLQLEKLLKIGKDVGPLELFHA